MPPAAAAAVVSIASSVLAFKVSSVIAQIAILTAGTLLSNKIAAKAIPQQSSLEAKQSGIKGLIRSGAEPAKIIYGKTLVGSTLAYAATTGEDNKYLHLICIIAAHQIESIEAVYLDETLTTDDKYGITTYNKWTVTVGGAYVADDDLTVTFDGVDVDTALSGSISTDQAATNIKASIDAAIAAETISNVDSVTVSGSVLTIYSEPGEDLVITTDSINTGFTLTAVNVQAATRSSVRITAYNGTQTTADSDAVSEITDWTSAHVLKGLAYAHIRLEFDRDVFNNVPTPRFLVKGARVYDPRSGLTAWSDNAALCIRDYLNRSDGLNVTSAQLPNAEWIAAANICDETVQETATQTSARYTINGVVSLAEKPGAILDDLSASMGGFISYSAGSFFPHPGAYITPTITLTADDLRGPVDLMPKRSRSELFNSIKGTHVNKNDNYSVTNFAEITNSIYIASDNDETIYSEIELPYTTDPISAQRLAKISLERNRYNQTIIFPAKMCGLNLQIMDTVKVTLDDFGFNEKVFQVVDWGFTKEGVDLVLVETNTSIFAWDTSEATVLSTVNAPTIGNPGRIIFSTDDADSGGAGFRQVRVTNDTTL